MLSPSVKGSQVKTSPACLFLKPPKFTYIIPKKYFYSLKSDSYLPKKIFYIFFNEGPLQMMKNAFYLILKTLFVLKIFRFLAWHFGHVEEMA